MFVKSIEILSRLVGNGNWITINGLDYDTLIVKDGIVKPSREEFDLVVTEVENEYINTAYQRQREALYPSFAEQFDILYHGGYDAWKSVIDTIKQQYPKPTTE